MYFCDMQCQADIQALADTKLKEADCLFHSGFFDGAFYLGGYAVELLLKAMVCKTLRIDDFFAFNLPARKELYKPYKVHDYEDLLILSGLYKEFTAAQADVTFKGHWSVVRNWSESARYLTGKTEKDAKDFLTSIHEFSQWIEKYL
jgi:HEPN domain-containing protein